jgi:hypothetical protein
MATTPSQVVSGTLRPDGTLELAEALHLPPGQVRVTVEALAPAAPPSRDIMQVLDRIHKAQRERGFVGRSKEEIDADVNALRDEWEDRMESLGRLQDEGRAPRADPE